MQSRIKQHQVVIDSVVKQINMLHLQGKLGDECLNCGKKLPANSNANRIYCPNGKCGRHFHYLSFKVRQIVKKRKKKAA